MRPGMGFVVDKVALGQVLLRVLQFFPHSTMALHAHISFGGRKIGPFVATVQRHSLTPSPLTTSFKLTFFTSH
jgi:hypothetical protein